jgi:hypothetical protein
VFRQKDDTFVKLLNEFRTGVVSRDAEQQLASAGSSLQKLAAENSVIKPTSVFALNRMVDEVNDRELQRCSDEAPVVFTASDYGEEPFLSTIRTSCIAPTIVHLKTGAQVMLLKNIDAAAGLVNGARGVIVDFVDGLPRVSFAPKAGSGAKIVRLLSYEEWTIELGSRVVANRRQIPLKLAYALSIHKSQGMTIDLLDIDMHGIFEYGQAYVALSRAVALDRVRIKGFKPACVRAHPTVAAYYAWLGAPGKKEPFVPPPPPSTEALGASGQPYAGGGSGACFKCGKQGHFSRECPGAGGGGGGGGGGRPFVQGGASSGGAKSCYKCGQPGHFANKCPGAGAGRYAGGQGSAPVVQRSIEDVSGSSSLLKHMHTAR